MGSQTSRNIPLTMFQAHRHMTDFSMPQIYTLESVTDRHNCANTICISPSTINAVSMIHHNESLAIRPPVTDHNEPALTIINHRKTTMQLTPTTKKTILQPPKKHSNNLPSVASQLVAVPLLTRSRFPCGTR